MPLETLHLSPELVVAGNQVAGFVIAGGVAECADHHVGSDIGHLDGCTGYHGAGRVDDSSRYTSIGCLRPNHGCSQTEQGSTTNDHANSPPYSHAARASLP